MEIKVKYSKKAEKITVSKIDNKLKVRIPNSHKDSEEVILKYVERICDIVEDCTTITLKLKGDTVERVKTKSFLDSYKYIPQKL